MDYEELQSYLTLKFLPLRHDEEYLRSVPAEVKYKMVTREPWSFFVTASDKAVESAFAEGCRLYSHMTRSPQSNVNNYLLKYLTQYYYEGGEDVC